MVTLITITVALFSAAVGAYITSMYFKDKGYNRLPSYKEATEMVDENSNQAETDIESTDPCDPNAYLIRHYRNGDGSIDAWVVCLREYTDKRAAFLYVNPYREFEVQDYKHNDLPDFGGFEFVYVNEDEDEDYNVVGFAHKEDAESIMNTIVKANKKSTFSLVEE